MLISIDMHDRLLDAARRTLGERGAAIVQEAAQSCLDGPLNRLTYAQVPLLLCAVEEQAPARAGRDAALALAEGLRVLNRDIEAGLPGRLLTRLQRAHGSVAAPLVRTIAGRHGIDLDLIDVPGLARLAAAIEADGPLIVGGDEAAALAATVHAVALATPPGAAMQIEILARRCLGPDGDRLLARFRRQFQRGTPATLDRTQIVDLAWRIEHDGPVWLGEIRLAAFMAEARRAMVSPAETLRERVLAVVARTVGPVGPRVVRRVSVRGGLPFDALELEHISWLAELLRVEAATALGGGAATALAEALLALSAETPRAVRMPRHRPLQQRHHPVAAA